MSIDLYNGLCRSLHFAYFDKGIINIYYKDTNTDKYAHNA